MIRACVICLVIILQVRSQATTRRPPADCSYYLTGAQESSGSQQAVIEYGIDVRINGTRLEAGYSTTVCPGTKYNVQISYPSPMLTYVETLGGGVAQEEENTGCPHTKVNGEAANVSTNIYVPCNATGALSFRVTAAPPDRSSILMQTTVTMVVNRACSACGTAPTDDTDGADGPTDDDESDDLPPEPSFPPDPPEPPEPTAPPGGGEQDDENEDLPPEPPFPTDPPEPPEPSAPPAGGDDDETEPTSDDDIAGDDADEFPPIPPFPPDPPEPTAPAAPPVVVAETQGDEPTTASDEAAADGVVLSEQEAVDARIFSLNTAPDCASRPASEYGYSCRPDIQVTGWELMYTISPSVEPPDNPCTQSAQPGNTDMPAGAHAWAHFLMTSTDPGWAAVAFAALTGSMHPAEAVLGGVSADGTSYINTYQLTKRSLPAADTAADSWAVHGGAYQQTSPDRRTVICFSRPVKLTGRSGSIRKLLQDGRGRYEPLDLTTSVVYLNLASSSSDSFGQHDRAAAFIWDLLAGTISLEGASSGDLDATVPTVQSGDELIELTSGGDSETDMHGEAAAHARMSKLHFVQLHGGLMIAAVLALMPLAVLVARHRWILYDYKLCGVPTWIILHTLLKVLGSALFITSAAIALTKFGDIFDTSSKVRLVHALLGLAGIVFISIQALGAVARPQRSALSYVAPAPGASSHPAPTTAVGRSSPSQWLEFSTTTTRKSTISPVYVAWAFIHTGWDRGTLLISWCNAVLGLIVYQQLYWSSGRDNQRMQALVVPAVITAAVITVMILFMELFRYYARRHSDQQDLRKDIQMDEIQDVELQHTPRLRRRTAVYIDDMSELQQDQRVRNSAEGADYPWASPSYGSYRGELLSPTSTATGSTDVPRTFPTPAAPPSDPSHPVYQHHVLNIMPMSPVQNHHDVLFAPRLVHVPHMQGPGSNDSGHTHLPGGVYTAVQTPINITPQGSAAAAILYTPVTPSYHAGLAMRPGLPSYDDTSSVNMDHASSTGALSAVTSPGYDGMTSTPVAHATVYLPEQAEDHAVIQDQGMYAAVPQQQHSPVMVVPGSSEMQPVLPQGVSRLIIYRYAQSQAPSQQQQ